MHNVELKYNNYLQLLYLPTILQHTIWIYSYLPYQLLVKVASFVMMPLIPLTYAHGSYKQSLTHLLRGLCFAFFKIQQINLDMLNVHYQLHHNDYPNVLDPVFMLLVLIHLIVHLLKRPNYQN